MCVCVYVCVCMRVYMCIYVAYVYIAFSGRSCHLRSSDILVSIYSNIFFIGNIVIFYHYGF